MEEDEIELHLQQVEKCVSRHTADFINVLSALTDQHSSDSLQPVHRNSLDSLQGFSSPQDETRADPRE